MSSHLVRSFLEVGGTCFNPSVLDTELKVDTNECLMDKESLKLEPNGKVGDVLTTRPFCGHPVSLSVLPSSRQ